MKFILKYLHAILFIVAVAGIYGAYTLGQPKFKDFVLITPSGEEVNIERPGFFESKGAGLYTMTGTVVVSRFSTTNFRIIPDDRIDYLEINGQMVELSGIPLKSRSDYIFGFSYDLKDYLKIGENNISARYYDRGGLMGLVLAVDLANTNAFAILIFVFVILLIVFRFWLKREKIVAPVAVIFFLALALRLLYFAQTDVGERAHDMGDHIGYTQYFSENWTLPPVEYSVGGAYFHPPLSYFLSGMVYRLSQKIEPDNKVMLYKVQQFFCLFVSLGFLLYGLLILQEMILTDEDQLREESELNLSWFDWMKSGIDRQTLIIISALFAFWPSAIIHSSRIGNDPMLYSFFAAGMYYILRWYRNDLNRDLIIASCLAAAATLTKANGEILIAALGLIGLFRMIKSKQWVGYLKRSMIPLAIVLPAFAITVGPAVILKMEGKRDKLYIDNIDGLSKANIVGNTAANYFWFDAKVFITEPFTDPYDDRYGRQFFWNYLGKTGLVGEFKYPYPLGVNCAVMLSALAVAMFIYMVVGMYHVTTRKLEEMVPILLIGFLLWAGVTYMRMTFPANIDFRYIVPILITSCMMYGVSILQFERIGAVRAARIGQGLALCFACISVLFITTVD